MPLIVTDGYSHNLNGDCIYFFKPDKDEVNIPLVTFSSWTNIYFKH